MNVTAVSGAGASSSSNFGRPSLHHGNLPGPSPTQGSATVPLIARTYACLADRRVFPNSINTSSTSVIGSRDRPTISR